MEIENQQETAVTETEQTTESSAVEEQVGETVSETTANESGADESGNSLPQKEAVGAKEKAIIRDLQKERARRRELEDRIAALEIEKSKTKSNTAAIEAVKSKLGLNDEQAADFVEAVGKVNDTKKDPVDEELKRIAPRFAAKAEEVSQDYEDWGDYRAEMQKLLEDKYSAIGAKALLLDPEDYYHLAKSRVATREAREARQAGRKEMADKINSKNLATTGSSRTSAPPSGKKVWTKDEIREKSQQKGWYEKNRDEILSAMQQGRIQ
jgi:hypothetical protein